MSNKRTCSTIAVGRKKSMTSCTTCLNICRYAAIQQQPQAFISHSVFCQLQFTIFSERELVFTFAICYRPSICLSSVTLVRPTQAVQIFGNISTALGTLAIRWHLMKISRRSSRGTPPPGELNTRGVAKYSDFGPIDGYISEMVQDRR